MVNKSWLFHLRSKFRAAWAMLNLGILPEVTCREGVSHVFAAEVNMQTLAALTFLDNVYLSLLPEENVFVTVWDLLVVVGL